jgi:carbonic anhydrase
MSLRSSARCSFALSALSAALSVLLSVLPAQASEASSEPAAAPHGGVAAIDAMSHLKARLEEKLGAAKLREAAPGSHDLKVVARATPSAPSARPSRVSPEVEAAVAAHRSGRDAKKGEGSGAVHWGYGGEGGPNQWASLKPEFSVCGEGKRQSPIDIRNGISVDLEPLTFDYRPTGFSVIDNGHTVQVNMGPGNTVEVMGRRYELVQFHFHRPSEERINGRLFEMSVHLVHRDPEGRLAVVAVLLERGAAQDVVQQVWNNLPLEKHEALMARDAINPAGLLPQDLRYFTYMGSLTTPPCTEGVLWMVMQEPVPVAAPQIDIFSRLYPMNARPVQQASGRLIKQSQ